MASSIPFPNVNDENDFSIDIEDLTKADFERIIQAAHAFAGIEKKMYPYQAEAAWRVIKAIIQQKDIEFDWYWARKTGKSFTAACVIYFLAVAPLFVKGLYFKQGIHMVCFGPKEEQASFIYKEADIMFRFGFIQAMFEAEVETLKKVITVRKDYGEYQYESSLGRSSASQEASIEGPTLTLVFVDEAQDVTDDRLEKSIDPMLATTMGVMVLLGTTTYEHEFYFMTKWKDVQRRGEAHASKNISINRWESRAQYDPKYKKFVEGRIRKRGLNNPAVRASYFLEVSPTKGATFKFMREGDDLLALRSGDLVKEYDGPCYCSIDVAKEHDATVVTVFDPVKSKILNWLWIRPATDGPVNYMEQRHEIRDFLRSYPGLYLIVPDGNGVGPAVGDDLNMPPVRGICEKCKRDFTDYPSYEGMVQYFPSSRPRNSLAAITARQAIINHEFTYPDADVPEVRQFEKEVHDLEAKWVGPKLDQMWTGHPERKGYHDDFFTSFMLTLWGLQFPVPESSSVHRSTHNSDRSREVTRRGNYGRSTRHTFKDLNNHFNRLEIMLAQNPRGM